MCMCAAYAYARLPAHGGLQARDHAPDGGPRERTRPRGRWSKGVGQRHPFTHAHTPNALLALDVLTPPPEHTQLDLAMAVTSQIALALAKTAWTGVGLLEGHALPAYMLVILGGEAAAVAALRAARLGGSVRESLPALKAFNLLQAGVAATVRRPLSLRPTPPIPCRPGPLKAEGVCVCACVVRHCAALNQVGAHKHTNTQPQLNNQNKNSTCCRRGATTTASTSSATSTPASRRGARRRAASASRTVRAAAAGGDGVPIWHPPPSKHRTLLAPSSTHTQHTTKPTPNTQRNQRPTTTTTNINRRRAAGGARPRALP